MPHEKINHPHPDNYDKNQLVVAWNDGWVNLSIYPDGWSHTGEAHHVALPENEIDLLIKTLRRAKRSAYRLHVQADYEPTARTQTEPLFNRHQKSPY